MTLVALLATVVSLFALTTSVDAGASTAPSVVPVLAVFACDGTYGVPTPGPVRSSALKVPSGVAFDSSGNCYIADQGNNVVLKVTPAGTLSIFAGIVGPAGDPTPGPATSSHLRGPSYLAVDASDNVYIADQINNVVEKVTPDGTLSIVAGMVGSVGVPTPGPATSSSLGIPGDLVFDPSGNLFIALTGASMVVKVTPSGTLSIVAGDGSYAAPAPGPATSSPMKVPAGLALDSLGNLYISDLENFVVMKVTPSGTLSVVAGSGDVGTPSEGPATSSMLTGVFDITFDSAGNLILADAWSNRVLKVTPAGALSFLVGSGLGGQPTEGPALQSALDAPAFLAFDSSGDLYICDVFNSVVERVSGLASSPSAPTSLVVTPGDGTASIAYSVDTGGAPISKVQYRIGNGSWTDAAGTSSPITITGLTNYQVARVRLRVENALGTSEPSGSISVRPRLSGPSLTRVKAAGSTRVSVAFVALTPVGGTVSHYWVYAYASGTLTVAGSCRSSTEARACMIKGLTSNTTYDVAVRGFFTPTGSPTVLSTLDSNRQTVRTTP